MDNGIAKPEDFRKACDQREQAVRLTLPKSGLPVMARRLTPLAALMTSEKLSKLDLVNGPAEDKNQFARILGETVKEVLFDPRISLTPDCHEIHPNWLPQEDVTFLFRWGLGALTDDGKDEFFRGESRPGAAPGAGGGDLPRPPEPAPQGHGDGSAD